MSRSRTPAARQLRVAWVLFTAGVLAVAGWAVWLFVGTDQLARNEAEVLRADFRSDCAASGVVALVDLGDGVEWPVRAGTDDDTLAHSVGWYPSTAAPGELGNTVLTGYRITHGSAFAPVADLKAGDRITLTTCTSTLTYEVVVGAGELTVDASADWILDAVPDHPGRMPTASMLTLVTSQDLVPTADREVIMAALVQ